MSPTYTPAARCPLIAPKDSAAVTPGRRRWRLGAMAIAVLVIMSMSMSMAVAVSEARTRIHKSSPYGVAITAPANGATVRGGVTYSASASEGTIRTLAYYVDGRLRWTDRAAPWVYGETGTLDTTKLPDGTHTLKVVGSRAGVNLATTSMRVTVANAGAPAPDASPNPAPDPPSNPDPDPTPDPDPGPAPAPDPTPLPTPTPTPGSTPAGGSWKSGFETGDLSEWTWWRDYNQVSTIQEPDGNRAVSFKVTAEDLAAGRKHSKLMQNWAIAGKELGWRDHNGQALPRLPGDSPAGTYRARFRLPADYRKSPERWTNILQFKQAFNDSSGAWHQDPQWWINMSQAGKWGSAAPSGMRADAPVMHVNHWDQDYARYSPKLRAVPLGRWFELKAELYPGNRIEWYLDGELFDTSFDSTYPVGVSESQATGWVFGVGHYDGIGELFADDASFSPR